MGNPGVSAKCFDEVGQQILGISANAWAEMNEQQMQQRVEAASNKQCIGLCRHIPQTRHEGFEATLK